MRRNATALGTVLVLGLGLLLVGGCGSSDAAKVAPTTTASPPTSDPGDTTSSTATTGPTSTTVGFDGSLADQSGDRSGGTAVALLTAVRAAHDAGFDRVVFEFRGADTPRWTVGYANGPFTEDPSGEAVTVPGSAYLQVRMQGASGADVDTGTTTYAGPKVVDGVGTTTVLQVARLGDFEGELTWVIGVGEKTAFHVSTLTNPSRLVVDVADA